MRLPFPFRRGGPVLEPLDDIPTRAVAVGSLAGIAPADVRANLLVVLDADDHLSISGVACNELAALMLTRAAFLISQQIHDRHAHDEASPGPS